MVRRIYPRAEDRKTIRKKEDGNKIRKKNCCQEFKLPLQCFFKIGVMESAEIRIAILTSDADPQADPV